MKKSVTFEWWPADDEQVESAEHHEQLTDHSVSYIAKAVTDGYTQGSLMLEIDNTQYKGFWEIS